MKKWIWNLKQFYRNMRLQSKLMFTYLVIISIPMIVIALFFYGKVYNMLLSDTIRNEQEESSKTAPAIEEALEKVLQNCDAIQNLSFYNQIFSISDAVSLSTPENFSNAWSFSDEVNEILEKGVLKDVRIYMDLPAEDIDTLNELSNGSYFEEASKVKSTYWRGIFSGTGVSTLHCPAFYLSKNEIEKYSDLAYITKKTVHKDAKSYACYTAFYYSSDMLLEILKTNLPSDGSVSYIINERDSIIATTDRALSSYYYLNYEQIKESFMSSNNFLKKDVNGEDIYASMYNIKQPGWYMVVVIPSKPLVQKSNQIMIQYLLLFLGCIIIALFIAIRLSSSITNRIEVVTRQMAKVRTGPPIPLKESDSHDEIGDLIDTYNYMSTEMNDLLKERAKSAEELRIAEFDSLQAQINPHFLYNTMDMINWMAAQGRTSEITDAVQNLSRFYKLTLSKKETLSTIADEVEHASIYIRLQNMRYQDSITFVVDISDELMEYQIPKLTLQPVIENSILHGIMEKQEKSGCIVLTGWLEDDRIELLISDDGIGISHDKIQNILSGNGQSKTGSNIAIYNTHHRLQLLYGENYGLSYQSTPGKGTDVSIKLPAKKKLDSFHRNDIIQISAVNPQNNVVEPQTLLNYNDKISSDTYVLQNVHQISDKLPEKQSFYILTHEVTEDFPTHTHNYFEFSYCCRGMIINTIDGKDLYQAAGDFYILNRKAIQSQKPTHSTQYASDALLINLMIWPELLETSLCKFYETDTPLARFLKEDPANESNYLYFPLEHRLNLQTLLSSIIEEYSLTDYHLSEKLITLLDRFLNELTVSAEYSSKGLTPKVYMMLERIKDRCITENINTIAAEFGMKADELSDFIYLHTGRKPHNLVNQVRMNYAVELLQRPDLNLYDIIAACGFDDHEKFTVQFVKFFGITPDEYRKEII